jgi:hypothetical protein
MFLFRCEKTSAETSLGSGRDHAYAVLHVFRDLMTDLNSERRRVGRPPVKPWQLFDLMGGTGMGG